MAGHLSAEGVAAFTPSRRSTPDLPARESRTTLLDLSVGVVENLRRGGPCPTPTPEDYCGVFQVCLPYQGLFVWHAGGEEVVGDSNQVIFVRAGEGYRMSAPVAGGYRELVITPRADVLADVAGTTEAKLADHPLFRRRSALGSAALQSARACFLHWASREPGLDGMQADEVVVALLRSALGHDGSRPHCHAATTRRLIRRTKEFLQSGLSQRVRLCHVASAVGASPAYLTDTFTRVEGMPLHRYLMHLRLGHALAALPYTDDLTALALDTGFSSHSHFTAVFRRTFGSTPSAFRQASRRTQRMRVKARLDRTA